MKLSAKVISLNAGNRMTLKFPKAVGIINTLDFANDDNFALDDEIEVTVERRVAGDPTAPAPWEAQDGSLDIS